MSDAARDQAAVPTEQGEEGTIPSQTGTGMGNVTNIYYGPTNVVGQAHNTNFGTNYGSINHGARSNPPAADLDARNAAPHTSAQPSIAHGNDLVTLLNPILDASHTRNMSLSPPNSECFPGTRLKVTKKIRSWMDSSLLFANPHIMWVYGYAGCGKSAIAQEMARYFAGANRLAAAFFFFRGAGDRSRIVRFATTVASQVAAAIPATASFIERAVKANPGLLTTKNTSLADQFEHLVYRPINSVKWDKFAASLRQDPFLIVLDGVDECEDRNEVAVFIERMIEFFDRKPRTPLRFLITSRVENHIHKCLHSSKQVRLLDLVKHTSSKDIMCALEAVIAKEQQDRLLACDKAWPSLQDKVKLVEHIGGSYIFMTTILKCLFDPSGTDGLTPMERLPIVLSMNPDFDGLYKVVLEPCQHLPYFPDIISVVGLALEPLSIAQIADILDIGTIAVAKVLLNLHTIIQIPGDDHTVVTLWHTSLRDFLCCPDRAGSFVACNKHIAYGCLPLSAAGSGGPPKSPATQYATKFGKRHWTEFLESTNNDPNVLNMEFGATIVCLQRAFSASTITEFHFWAFDTLLLHLAGFAKNTAMAERDLSSGTSSPPPAALTKGLELKWTLLYMALHPEEWQAFRGTRTDTSDREGPSHWVGLLLQGGFSSDSSAGSCLHAACRIGREDIVQLLVQHGVDPNGKEYAKTPLRVACENDQARCAEVLLDHGANVAEGDLPTVLTWADQLYTRFETAGNVADLGVVLSLRREVLKHRPKGHPDHAKSLRSLAACLHVRSQKTGSIPDIDEAVRLKREVLEHRPEGHRDHVESLWNLSISLHALSEKTGSIPDIDEAVRLKREVLEHRPEGHPDHAKSLRSLSISLHERSEKTGSIPDIDEAVRLKREVLEHRPVGHPDHAKSLRSLSISLHARSEKTGSIPDIDEAVRLYREVLEHRPEGHPDHVESLWNLSISLHARSEKTGSIPDIDEAVRLKREVLEHRPQGHPDHVESLQTLVASLWCRFQKAGSLDDLQETIRLQREVLEFHPPSHKERAKSLENLAQSLRSLAEKTQGTAHKKEAAELDREAQELRSISKSTS